MPRPQRCRRICFEPEVCRFAPEGGARMALDQAGIKLYGGVQGDADAAVQAYIDGKLSYDPDVMCSHHDHGEGHSCGDHGCGNHGCH